MPVQYQIAGRRATDISASVESGVRTGALPAGAALPPVRELARQLSVSPATVAKAYQSLRQRGVVETAGRNGTRVRARPPVALSRAARRPPVPPGVRDLSAGEPDRRLLPDLRPQLRRLAADAWRPAGYTDAGTVPELVELARARLAADGVPLRDAELTVTGGALDGIERLLAAHLRPGDRVAVEDPGWANLLDLVAALGLEPVPVPVDDDGPTEAGLRAALADGVRAAVVTARAHNPTGAAVTRARAAALRRVLRGAGDVLVIEDDHAAELAPVPLHALAGATRSWAFLRSVAKPYGPDLRLALLAGDPATVARVAGRMRLGTGWVSTILQRLVLRMWRDGEVAAAVERAGREYDRRRGGLLAALAGRGVTARGRTGINVWVPVADETSAVARLREEGYAVAPGSLYRLSSPPGIRITVAGVALDDIPALAGAVSRALGAGERFPVTGSSR
ncbi:MAG TPA: aminotransferase class I/II-fold pyridoxal phosphate-dependent enzyme [Micromonosporaceae bacterium]|nr:aminotransferase class I/II-fold pyridoxal phosphate-dependent enzyme [Micromonosporaceae bacterium]